MGHDTWRPARLHHRQQPHLSGRFGIYIPPQALDLTVDLSELEDMSLDARCWIAGFIAGAEPSLQEYLGIDHFGIAGGPEPEITPAEYARWSDFRRRFNRDGTCDILNSRPWRPLRLTAEENAAIRLNPFRPWSVAGERVWVPVGETWVEADPQPPCEEGFRPGTICAEHGHSDLASLEDGWYLCLDCCEVIDCG